MNIVLVGIKGSGKSTVETYIHEHTKFKKVISYTTRPIREGEINNIDYHFIVEDEFLVMKNSNKFIEVVFNKINNSYYGITKNTLLNDNNVLVVEPNGLKQIINSVGKDSLFVVKLDCSKKIQIQRVFNRELPKSYEESKLILQSLKQDRKNFDIDINEDLLIDIDATYSVNKVVNIIFMSLLSKQLHEKEVQHV